MRGKAMASFSEREVEGIDPRSVRLTDKFVLLKRDNQGEKVGRFYVPDEFRKQANAGTIVAIGPNVQSEVPEVKTGDKAHVHGHAFIEARFKWEGDTYDIVKADDLIAIEYAEAA